MTVRPGELDKIQTNRRVARIVRHVHGMTAEQYEARVRGEYLNVRCVRHMNVQRRK